MRGASEGAIGCAGAPDTGSPKNRAARALARRALPCLIVVSLLAPALATPAARADAKADYDTCLALVASEPGRAESEAANWAAFGGGAPARHCHAMALLALGATARAAAALSDLGFEANALPDTTRSEILIQAAEAYLSIDETDLGLLAVDQALRLAVSAPGLETRARLRAQKEQWGPALADLDAAIDRAGPSPDRLMLRASARRREGRLVEAKADVLWTLELAPDLPVAYLELGRIEAEAGNLDPARTAFLDAIERDQGGDIAAAARRALQALEARN